MLGSAVVVVVASVVVVVGSVVVVVVVVVVVDEVDVVDGYCSAPEQSTTVINSYTATHN